MSGNPNQQAQITNREKWALERKAKQGWRMYFLERERNEEVHTTYLEARPLVRQIQNREQVDITHLTQMFLNLYEKVGEMCNCPVCFEPMAKDNIFVPVCSHLICKECKARVELCPICRKEY